MANDKRPRSKSDDSEMGSPKRVRFAPVHFTGRDQGPERQPQTQSESRSQLLAVGRKRMWQLTAQELALEEEKFELLQSTRMKAIIERPQQRMGAVADCGVFASLVMKNFMCHSHLALEFNLQCNFVAGINGSGKSAILSGLTIALGGQAVTTGRGIGLTSLIKEGAAQAEVTVGILNKGEDAYQPMLYGDMIYVSRTIPRRGWSTYKIQNSSRKILVSRSKKDLLAICSHFNIQVDNPLTVLTQDHSRQFLASFDPRDMYAFFMKGTLLTQLANEYDVIDEKISQARRLADGGRKILVDLKFKEELASARSARAEGVRKLEDVKANVEIKLAWAHVSAKEADLKDVDKRLSLAKADLRRLDQRLEGLQMQHGMAEAKLRAAAAEIHDPEARLTLELNKTALDKEIRTLNVEISTIRGQDDLIQLERRRQQHRKRILELQLRIEDEAFNSAAQSQKMSAAVQTRIDEHRAQVVAAEAMLREATVALNQYTATADASDGHIQASARTDAMLFNKQSALTKHLNDLKAQQASGLTAYGTDIRLVIQTIADSHAWATRMKPMGPLGLFVTLKDTTWAPVLRSYLGQAMLSFAVADARDMPILKRIFMKTGNGHIPIIISPVDTFDYTDGEPEKDVPTVLRALEISNEWALRILINSHKIERMGLTKTQAQAQKICENAKLPAALAAQDMLLVRSYDDGGGSVTCLTELGTTDRRQRLFISNLYHKICDIREEIGELRQKREVIHAVGGEHKAAAGEAKAQIQRVQTLERRLRLELRESEGKLHRLQEEQARDLPLSVDALKEAKAEHMAAIQSVERDYVSSQLRMRDTEAKLESLYRKAADMKEEIDIQDAEMFDLQVCVGEKLDKATKLENQVAALSRQREAAQVEIERLQAASDRRESELAEWTEMATMISPRVETTSSIVDLELELTRIANRLAEEKEQLCATTDTIMRDLAEARDDLTRTTRFYEDLRKLVETAECALDERRDKWCMFRMFMSLRCKMQFAYHLSCRSFHGKMMLKHSTGVLTLQVQSGDKKNAPMNDPRALSGGEKSFSTTCFLLSLWDCVGGPVRCLDEFDVFMDEVNRGVSMRMLMTAAQEADQKQFIIMSPQGLYGIKAGDSVKMLALSDPERAGSQA